MFMKNIQILDIQYDSSCLPFYTNNKKIIKEKCNKLISFLSYIGLNQGHFNSEKEVPSEGPECAHLSKSSQNLNEFLCGWLFPATALAQ